MSWISDLSNQVTASISQIEKTLDSAVKVNAATDGSNAVAATADPSSATSAQSWEARALNAEQRAEGLLKEGLVLAEKQGELYSFIPVEEAFIVLRTMRLSEGMRVSVPCHRFARYLMLWKSTKKNWIRQGREYS